MENWFPAIISRRLLSTLRTTLAHTPIIPELWLLLWTDATVFTRFDFVYFFIRCVYVFAYAFLRLKSKKIRNSITALHRMTGTYFGFFFKVILANYGDLLKRSLYSTVRRISMYTGRSEELPGAQNNCMSRQQEGLHDCRPRALIGCLQEFLLWQTNWPTSPWCFINTGKCHWADNQPAL